MEIISMIIHLPSFTRKNRGNPDGLIKKGKNKKETRSCGRGGGGVLLN